MTGLNPRQRDAVRYCDGPLLVLAGAGSGKTRVITEKLAYLAGECAMPPAAIVAITFTNKAAREMRERAEKRLGEKAREMFIGTFHAFGARFLREEAERVRRKSSFSIFDASDGLALLAELGKGLEKQRLRLIQGVISRWKNALLDPMEIAPRDALETQAVELYPRYERALAAYQAVDFDDLIRLPARLLAHDAMLAARWQARIGHLLIDECQDSNHCQNRLLRLLTGEKAAFTAVGDDDQSIYAWRGAEVDNIRRLIADYPQLRVIVLEQNYRSTGRILSAANALIRNNPKLFEKKLWSEKGEGAPIRVKVCEDEAHEAEWVIARILAHKFENRGRFADYAILYRSNHQARVFEQALRAQRVPYRLAGGQSFFEKSEIKDVLAYLRLFANENDDPAFLRAAATPRRGIGAATLEALGKEAGRRQLALLPTIFAPGLDAAIPSAAGRTLREFGAFVRRFAGEARTLPAGEACDRLLVAIGYRAWLEQCHAPREAEARWEHVREFRDWLAAKGEEEGKDLVALAQTVALATMLEHREKDGDAVHLSTLHAAKGLEFPHVFLVSVEEGVLPHHESLAAQGIEEERRLMYVGITRSRETLTITWRRRRRQGQDAVPCEPSRFIAEMGEAAQPATTPGGDEKATGRARLAAFKALLERRAAAGAVMSRES